MRFDLKTLDTFPMQPGVYIMKDVKGKVLYIGKAKQLKTRVKQYFLNTADTRAMIPYLLREIATIDTLVVPSEKEALLLENTLIKKHQPKFNAVLKDDKTFISLMINHRNPWPMIRLVRCKGKAREDALYFGPYTSAYAAKKTYELLTRLFPLRQCSDQELARRVRPCLLYSMKRCIAPCVSKCTHEEYALVVKRAIAFLKGEDREIAQALQEEISLASKQLNYEKAASLLETLRQIEHVLNAQTVVAKREGKSSDALALYREGEELLLVQLFFREGKLVGSAFFSFKGILEEEEALLSSFILQHYTKQTQLPQEILTPLPLVDGELISEILGKSCLILCPQKGEKKALVDLAIENAKALFYKEKNAKTLQENRLFDLQTTLKLTRYPRTIACFDTSHLAGSHPVASLVLFIEGIKEGKAGRLFHIKKALKGDDYGALQEVLLRYLTKAKEEDTLPDLLIVDGGKGQLHVAQGLFRQLDIASVDLIALTKERGRHDKGMTGELVFLQDHHDPVRLKTTSPLLFLLQNIRDETHRKALYFHRSQRTKHTLTSALDEIPGIGPIKKKRLLQHFGSVEKIRQASEEELLKVKGITAKDLHYLSGYLIRK